MRAHSALVRSWTPAVHPVLGVQTMRTSAGVCSTPGLGLPTSVQQGPLTTRLSLMTPRLFTLWLSIITQSRWL